VLDRTLDHELISPIPGNRDENYMDMSNWREEIGPEGSRGYVLPSVESSPVVVNEYGVFRGNVGDLGGEEGEKKGEYEYGGVIGGDEE